MVPADSRKVSPASRYSGYPPLRSPYAYRPFTSYGAAFQAASTLACFDCAGPTTPRPVDHGLGSSPFARHYLGNHYCFLFLRVLRCFSSPGLPPPPMAENTMPSTWWVAPLGDLRMILYVPIPAAFRSLSRPSSPLRAKASSIRPFLDHVIYHNDFYYSFL